MRRSTLSLLALGGFLLAGCASSSGTKDVGEMEPERQVEWLLAKDQRYSNELGRRQDNGVPADQAISIYVDSVSAIDLSMLPEDVRTTFRDHQEAWQQYERALSNSGVDLASMVNIGQSAFRAKASGGLDIPALLTLLREIQSEMQSQEGKESLSKIDETWDEVRSLATEYGATPNPPPLRYPDEKLVSFSEIEAKEGDWDPDIGGFSAPDIRLSLRVNGTPTCMTEGKDSYVFAPECTFLVRPSSTVEVEVVDDDVGQPEVIGRWRGSGDEFLSLESFGQVRRLDVDEK